jgi:hypothetical protein
MEQLELTDPVVVPEKVTASYRVIALTLNWTFETIPGAPGLVGIDLRDNHDEPFSHRYVGPEAIALMKWLNTANFSVNSMHKRILQKLSAEGVLPGTVTGTPDA